MAKSAVPRAGTRPERVEGLLILNAFATGRSFRKDAPRSSHATWRPPADREDPVATIERIEQHRVRQLIPIRHARMAASPFAFFRGAAAIMAADLATTPLSGLHVQACGDAHLSNFGAYATPERQLVFDVNDFDETLPGPWEWDLKRLATSCVLAARHNGFSRADCAEAALEAAGAYRTSMRRLAKRTALEVWYSSIDATSALTGTDAARRETVEREFPKMTQVVDGAIRLVDKPPLVFHPTGALDVAGRSRHLIERYRKSLRDDIRSLFDRYSLVDSVIRVVGIGSVGTICGVALLMAGPVDPLLIQFKEAVASVLEPYVGPSPYKNHGERAVTGQRRMQAASDIFLGWTSDDEGHDFYFRQLRDMKLAVAVDGLSPARLIAYAALCGKTLARAHARTGMPGAIGGYMGSSDAFDRSIASFAASYADQTESDYEAFLTAIAAGRLKVESERTP